jgi:hypothetical protein
LNVFAGFEFALRENWKSRVEAPVKPGNWKPETWKEKEAEAWEKKADPTVVTSGRVVRTFAFDHETGVVTEGDARGFITALSESVRKYGDVRLYGFRTFEAMRLMLWEAVEKGVKTEPWMWSSFEDRTHMDLAKLHITDLYMLSGAKGADIPVTKWLELWDIHTVKKVGDLAEAAYSAAKKMGFVS